MNYFNPCPRCEEKREKEHATLVAIARDGYGKMSQSDYQETIDLMAAKCVPSNSLKEAMDYTLRSGKMYYHYRCFCSVCQYEVSIKDGVVNLA